MPDGSPSTPEEGTSIVWTVYLPDETNFIVDYSSYDRNKGYYFAPLDSSLVQGAFKEFVTGGPVGSAKITARVSNSRTGIVVEDTALVDLLNPSQFTSKMDIIKDTYRDDVATCEEQLNICIKSCEERFGKKPYEVPIDRPKPVEPGRSYKGELGFENGCRLNGRILPFGARIKGEYCDWDGTFKTQKQPSESAENSFECLSNFASNGQCVDVQQQMGILKKILNFFSKLFGGE